MNQAYAIPNAAATRSLDERREFIKKTYLTLLVAVGVFALGAFLMVTSGLGAKVTHFAAGSGMLGQALMLGGFIGIGFLSQRWAVSGASKQLQYLGLMVGALGYAFFFTPILYIASYYVNDGPQIIAKAGIMTGFIFAGLTATVIITKKDFSFLRGILSVGFFGALGLIVVGMLFGFNLGSWFSFAMIALLAGSVLYNTSNVFQRFPTDMHVAAALVLFSDIAMMFFYVLRLLLAFAGDD